MMKRLLFCFLHSLFFISTATAQLTIDGRHVCLDTVTNTLLATIPENYFGQSITLNVSLEPEWHSGMIDEIPIQQNYTFEHITASQKYHILLYQSNGHIYNV